jgi:hypothetical protein
MIRILVIFFVFIGHSFAQSNPEEMLDSKFYSVSILVNNPLGKYKKDIKTNLSNLNSAGLSISYYFNPRYNSSMSNKVFLGAEIGLLGQKQTQFNGKILDGDFYINHRQTWLNLGFKYRPNLWPTRLNPYFEATAGPKIYTSNFIENYGEDQTDKILGTRAFTLNYGIGVGCGYKIMSSIAKSTYLELGVKYNASNSLKIMNKEKVGFDDFNAAYSNKIQVRPQDLIFNLGITNFL